MNDKIESGRDAVQSAISGLKKLMMTNTDNEKIGKGMKSLVQSQSRTEHDRRMAQESIRTAFKFDKS